MVTMLLDFMSKNTNNIAIAIILAIALFVGSLKVFDKTNGPVYTKYGQFEVGYKTNWASLFFVAFSFLIMCFVGSAGVVTVAYDLPESYREANEALEQAGHRLALEALGQAPEVEATPEVMEMLGQKGITKASW